MTSPVKFIPEVHALSMEERIGQTLCFGWQGENQGNSMTVNSHARALVEEMRVGSVVVMGRNVGPPDVTRAVLGEMQSLSAVPLFVAVDQEGGVVNRFKLRGGVHEFCGAMALGAIQPVGVAADCAFRQAQAQARELAALGVNWNFAPVADVNNNPDNPIIGVRSFGEEPCLVAKLGVAMARGYQENGLLACAKHFPGHGDTAVDSHLALPTVTGDRARMDAVELVPFRALIQAGIGAIMTTHILFPALDPERPATLSPAVLTGLLRRELGYQGVVITDCLEMEAIAGTVGTPRGAVEALKAGADVVLVCHTLETQRATVEAIRAAVASGELSEERVTEAADRVLRAKRRYIAQPQLPGETPLNWPAHDALEEEIARSSVTVVRGDTRPRFRRNADVLLASAHPAVEAFGEELRRHTKHLEVLRYGPAFEGTDRFKVENLFDRFEHVVFLTAPPEPWGASAIDQELQAKHVRLWNGMFQDRLVVIALREPYDLRRFPKVRNYLCGYGYRPATLRALADAIFGQFTPTGRLPVTIPVDPSADFAD